MHNSSLMKGVIFSTFLLATFLLYQVASSTRPNEHGRYRPWLDTGIASDLSVDDVYQIYGAILKEIVSSRGGVCSMPSVEKPYLFMVRERTKGVLLRETTQSDGQYQLSEFSPAPFAAYQLANQKFMHVLAETLARTVDSNNVRFTMIGDSLYKSNIASDGRINYEQLFEPYRKLFQPYFVMFSQPGFDPKMETALVTVIAVEDELGWAGEAYKLVKTGGYWMVVDQLCLSGMYAPHPR